MKLDRAVLFVASDTRHVYYLSSVKRDESGRVIWGRIENGTGIFEYKDGKYRGKSGNSIWATWEDPGYTTVDVPPEVSGDYNDIIWWAIGQYTLRRDKCIDC